MPYLATVFADAFNASVRLLFDLYRTSLEKHFGIIILFSIYAIQFFRQRYILEYKLKQRHNFDCRSLLPSRPILNYYESFIFLHQLFLPRPLPPHTHTDFHVVNYKSHLTDKYRVEPDYGVMIEAE